MADATKAKKFKIEYDRRWCIWAAVCCALCDKFWKLNDDGKADLIGATSLNDNALQVLEIDEADVRCNQDAAEACPVNVIHIKNMETGESLI